MVRLAGHLYDERVQGLDNILKVGPALRVGVPAPRHHLLQRLHKEHAVERTLFCTALNSPVSQGMLHAECARTLPGINGQLHRRNN